APCEESAGPFFGSALGGVLRAALSAPLALLSGPAPAALLSLFSVLDVARGSCGCSLLTWPWPCPSLPACAAPSSLRSPALACGPLVPWSLPWPAPALGSVLLSLLAVCAPVPVAFWSSLAWPRSAVVVPSWPPVFVSALGC